MEKYIQLLIFAVLFTTLSSMNGCKNSNCATTEKTEVLDPYQMKTLVYKGNEKLTFIDSITNDSHIFIGQGYLIKSNTQQAGQECQVIYHWKNSYLNFISIDHKDTLYTWMGHDYCTDDPFFYIKFKLTYYCESVLQLSNPNIYDSIVIHNTKYYGVKYFRWNVWTDHLDSSNKYGCYYNLTYGILKMETNDGHKWELARIQ